MNGNKKIKGLTFLETILCVTIVLIVSSFSFFKILKINESIELEKNRRIIQETFIKYTNKSLLTKVQYAIELDFLEKKITIKNRFNRKMVEEIEISKKLKYEIIYNYTRNSKFKIETTINGNISKAFTIYLFGYYNQVEDRIAFYVFQREQVLKINIYKNVNVKNVNYQNILEYHYSEEGQNRIGWKEEL